MSFAFQFCRRLSPNFDLRFVNSQYDVNRPAISTMTMSSFKLFEWLFIFYNAGFNIEFNCIPVIKAGSFGLY